MHGSLPQTSVGLFITEGCIITGVTPQLKGIINANDKILEVDGGVVDGRTVLAALRGSDIIGTKVHLKIKSATKGTSYQVTLVRQARSDDALGQYSSSGVGTSNSNNNNNPGASAANVKINKDDDMKWQQKMGSNSASSSSSSVNIPSLNLPNQQPATQQQQQQMPSASSMYSGYSSYPSAAASAAASSSIPPPFASPPPPSSSSAYMQQQQQHNSRFSPHHPKQQDEGDMSLDQALDEIDNLEAELQDKDRELDELDDELATAKQDLMLTKMDLQNAEKKNTELKSLVENLTNDKNKLHLDWQKACEYESVQKEMIADLRDQISRYQAAANGMTTGFHADELMDAIHAALDSASADWVKSQNRMRLLYRSALRKGSLPPEEAEKHLQTVLDENSQDWVQAQARLQSLQQLATDLFGKSLSKPEYSSTNEEVDRLRNQISLLETEKQEAQAQIRNLTFKIERISESHSSASEQAIHAERVAYLQSVIEEEKMKHAQQIRELTEKISKMEYQRSQDNSLMTSHMESLTKLEEEKNKEKIENKMIQDDLNRANSLCKDMEQSLRKSLEECAALEARNCSLEEEVSEYKRQITEVVNSQKSQPDLSRQIHQKDSALAHANAKIEQLESEVKDKIMAIVDSDVASSRIKALESELSHSQERAKQLELRLTSLGNRHASIDVAQERIKSLEEQVRSLQAEREVMDAQDRVQQIADRLQAAQELRRELVETRGKIQSLEEQLHAAQQQGREVDRLQSKIKMLEEQLERKNSSISSSSNNNNSSNNSNNNATASSASPSSSSSSSATNINNNNNNLSPRNIPQTYTSPYLSFYHNPPPPSSASTSTPTSSTTTTPQKYARPPNTYTTSPTRLSSAPSSAPSYPTSAYLMQPPRSISPTANNRSGSPHSSSRGISSMNSTTSPRNATQQQQQYTPRGNITTSANGNSIRTIGVASVTLPSARYSDISSYDPKVRNVMAI